MSDAIFVSLAALLGAAVGWSLRPVVARYEAPMPVGLLEAVTALLFGAAAWHYDDWQLVPILVLFAASVALSAIDLVQYRLPNDVVFPTLFAVVLTIFVGELLDGSSAHVVAAIVGAVVYCAILYVLHVVSPGGMGFGDVKLALVLGFVLGWIARSKLESVRAVMMALLIGSVLGVVLGVGRIAVLRLGGRFLTDPEAIDGEVVPARSTTFPFGPPLMIGTAVIVLWPATFLG